ncbi:MAG: multi-sensor signal transduction histidine kinase [Proteobacteria bacterium]|nr:multi-sensor signal transduction histidine kinase [Pseudomonadota bacterium]
MPEQVPDVNDELENLRLRSKKLAMEKSYLQLIIRLMSRISSASGLDDTVDNMMRSVVDVLGGANIILYYVIDDTVHYSDVYGKKVMLETIEDEQVQKAFETCEPLEYEHDFSDTKMLTPEFSKAYTWVYPLMVRSELIGVFKMESLHFNMRELYQHLPIFFNYAALVLKNEIMGHTRLKKAYDQLEAVNKELEAFAYSVSHDLRAPLRSIDGFSQALLEDYGSQLDAMGQDYLRRVRAASQRMAQLIDDMLQLSRLTRGEMSIESVDLSAVVEDVLADLKHSEPDRQVECIVAPGIQVSADPRLLRAVMENLLGNAWKYTGKHPSARIEFGVTHRDGKRAYFVRDDGAGFDMHYVGKLFAPFQRLHAMEEFSGNGIGLATVQRIIRRHGGQVWAEGEVERGATFTFTLS